MAIITVNDVRQRLMDYDDVNMPLFTKQIQDEDLAVNIADAVDDFNETPPIFTRVYTVDNFPFKQLLLDGAVVRALKLAALKELRGEMQYNDGGVSSTINYKFSQFTALRQELEQKYEQDKLRRKRQLNMQACYGGIT